MRVNQLKSLIGQGLTSVEIGKVVNKSYPTVLKYCRILLSDFWLIRLSNNGKAKKARSNFKDGRSVYRKYKKDYCEMCGAKEIKLECHHKTPAQYNEKWLIVKGDHSKANIITVCNSCHQKIHYRELGRKANTKIDIKTGRYLRKEIVQ